MALQQNPWRKCIPDWHIHWLWHSVFQASSQPGEYHELMKLQSWLSTKWGQCTHEVSAQPVAPVRTVCPWSISPAHFLMRGEITRPAEVSTTHFSQWLIRQACWGSNSLASKPCRGSNLSWPMTLLGLQPPQVPWQSVNQSCLSSWITCRCGVGNFTEK